MGTSLLSGPETILVIFYMVTSLMKFHCFRYATSVVPIGSMFAMTLWLGNTAYLYISVAFAQMLKAISKFLVIL